ncbi:unnamed protein product, partial [Rotaria socialis]
MKILGTHYEVRFRAARCSGPKWGTLISKWGARRVQLSCKWGTFG